MFSHHDKSKDAPKDAKHMDKHVDNKHVDAKHMDKKLDDKHVMTDKEKKAEEKKLHEKQMHDIKANAPHVSLLNEPTRLEMKAAAAMGVAPVPIGHAAGHWENNVLNPTMFDSSYESNQENLARNGLRQGKPIIGQIDASQRAALEPEIQKGDISLGIKGQELAGQRNVVATSTPAINTASSTIPVSTAAPLKQHNESLGHLPVSASAQKPIVQEKPITQPIQQAPIAHTTHTTQSTHLQQSKLDTMSVATIPMHDLKITPAVSHKTVSTSHETIDVAHQGGLLHSHNHLNTENISSNLHTEKIHERPITTGTSHIGSTHTGTTTHSTHTATDRSSGMSQEAKLAARDAASMRGSNPMTDGGSMGMGPALGLTKGNTHHAGLTNDSQDAIKSVPEGAYSKERDMAIERTNETLNQQQYATGNRL